jgi:hypothetical protein
MLKPYAEPRLERYGAIRDLTQQVGGKSVTVADGTGVFDTCNPRAQPGSDAGCPGVFS